MKCIQCVIWFFVISVCVGESVLSYSRGWHLAMSDWIVMIGRWLHFVCVVLLAVLYVPAFRWTARSVICVCVGLLLFFLGNWFAASLILVHGAITVHMGRRGRDEMLEGDEEDVEGPSTAFPACFDAGELREATARLTSTGQAIIEEMTLRHHGESVSDSERRKPAAI